jgi:hypothetical protein
MSKGNNVHQFFFFFFFFFFLKNRITLLHEISVTKNNKK